MVDGILEGVFTCVGTVLLGVGTRTCSTAQRDRIRGILFLALKSLSLKPSFFSLQPQLLFVQV